MLQISHNDRLSARARADDTRTVLEHRGRSPWSQTELALDALHHRRSEIDSEWTREPEHLRAALEVWRYAEDSARYIFGEATGDPVADEPGWPHQRPPPHIVLARSKRALDLHIVQSQVAPIIFMYRRRPDGGRRLQK